MLPQMLVDMVYRQAFADDALCLLVRASQVFLDTYATNGVNLDLANEVMSVLSKGSRVRDIPAGPGPMFGETHTPLWGLGTDGSDLHLGPMRWPEK